MHSKYLTFREMNQIVDRRGWSVKSIKDFEFICLQRWHKKTNELNFLFKMANRNREIKRHWMAKNVNGIWKYHRIKRCSRLSVFNKGE